MNKRLNVANENFNPKNFKKTTNKISKLIKQANKKYLQNIDVKFEQERKLHLRTSVLSQKYHVF